MTARKGSPAGDRSLTVAAFLAHWIKPRRVISRKALERFQEQGQLPDRFDIEQVLDAMYGPLYFLLLVRHGKLGAAYAESLAEMLVHGLSPR